MAKALLDDALRRKAAFRKAAGQMSWEEKVASVERMRAASIEARRSMDAAMAQRKSGKARKA